MTENVNFTAAIRGIAADMGRAPSPEQVDDLDDALRSIVHRDDGGELIATAGDRQMGVVSYIRMAAASFDKAAPSAATTPGSTDASRSQAERDADQGILRVGSSVQHGRPRGDAFADIARGFQAAQAAALAQEAADWPNPWAQGSENRTRQTILSRIDPTRAAKFREEAGA